MDNENIAAKLLFIESCFEYIENKIKFLRDIETDHYDEALLLCCCYIDGLAQGLYWPASNGKSKEYFVTAIYDYGRNDNLKLIWPKKLLQALTSMKKKTKNILDLIESIQQNNVDKLFAKDEIMYMVEKVIDKNDIDWLKSQLWRGSLAAVAYERIRSSFAHEINGPMGISFSSSTHKGLPIPGIDFNTLYPVLMNIYKVARERSIDTVSWFGHDFKTIK